MTIHATVVLDSGAFFQNIAANENYDKLEIGFFGSDYTPTELQVIADGKIIPAQPAEATPLLGKQIDLGKVGKGRIEVIFKKANGTDEGIVVTEALDQSLLRLSDLYPENTPTINEEAFDCVIEFTSGRFCCSMVKVRPFAEWDGDPPAKTGKREPTKKAISHNVAVHFVLEDGDTLQLIKDKDIVLFTSKNLPENTRRIDIDIVADNSTAERFYRDGLNLKSKATWLPNQGDPPTVGPP